MKRILSFFLIALCAALIGGCAQSGSQEEQNNSPAEEVTDTETGETQTPETLETLPFEQSLSLMFASGVGGWSTDIALYPDGSFEGIYHDSEMGSSGEDFPNGTVYVCGFSGKYENIIKTGDTAYSMTLGELVISNENEGEWIEDGIKYIPSEPYGMERGTEFILYTPETPVEGLSEEFLSWWPDWLYSENGTPETLSCFGLYNEEGGYGFFTYDYDQTNLT